jgi:hypothetical protein
VTPADHDHSLSQEQGGVHVGFNEERVRAAVVDCATADVGRFLLRAGRRNRRTFWARPARQTHAAAAEWADRSLLAYSPLSNPTSITMEIRVKDGTAEFSIDKTSIERLGPRQILPIATKVLGSIGAGPFRYEAAAPGERSVYVELQCYPASVGSIRSMIIINDTREIVLRQFMVP